MKTALIRMIAQASAFSTLVAMCSHTLGEEAIIQELRSCAAISDDARRLACFDAVISTRPLSPDSSPVETVPPESAATAPAPGTLAEPETATVDDDFGKEHWVESEDKSPSLESQVQRVTKSSQGHLVITLTNGQVWKQRNVKNFTVREGDTVVIERGSLNSFFLRVDGGSRLERFYRVR